MIIKLGGANFSENNIGFVDLRTAPSAETQAILNVYGKTWTLAQKLLIEDFLTDLAAKSFYSKIQRLMLPILAKPATINTNYAAQPAFYDIVSKTNLALTFGGLYEGNSVINANGFSQPNYTNMTANNYIAVVQNLSSSYNKDDIHYGVYAHKLSSTGSGQTIITLGGVGLNLDSKLALKLGYSSGILQANIDLNTYYNRGLKIMSWNGSQINGMANDLPFSSVSGAATNASYENIVLLNRGTDNKNTTIGLITYGKALTQNEVVEYNSLIKILMDALWVL